MHMNGSERIAPAVLLLAVLVLPAGCAPPFPQELLDRTDTQATFESIRKDPVKYAGRLVMLGGTVVDAVQLKEGTRLEVLQRPLDGQGRPELTDETGGRFLILTGQFLDGAVYHRGRTVTVIGVVEAPQVLPLGEIKYSYAVVTARALHLWSPYSGPRFSIGIGVYRGF